MGGYALVGQRAGGSPGQPKARDIDFSKVNFKKLTGDQTESQGLLESTYGLTSGTAH